MVVGEIGLNIPRLDDATTTLSQAETERFAMECAAVAARLGDATLDSPQVLAEIEVAGCRLPDRLLRELSRFRCGGNRFGGLVIRNLPIDRPLPATPAGDAPNWRSVQTATIAQLAVASRLGEVIAYADEKHGHLVQDVTPVRGAENRQENSGTVPLELHTEDGFHPYKPDFVTLLCLRPDPDRVARTLLTSVSRVLPHLSAADIATLREPLFRIRVSSSFTGSERTVWSSPMPVLSGPADDPEFVADVHAMEALTGAGAEVLRRLAATLIATVAGVVLDAADLLIIDNRIAVHGRTGFSVRYDAENRWLRRCFMVADLHSSRAARGRDSRVFAPLSRIGLTA